VRNTRGYAEQYKGVIHEDALKAGGASRAPFASAGLADSSSK
jgi:hypothetical protein